jgi:glycosyltransferase involved in cell wall biosynthesis
MTVLYTAAHAHFPDTEPLGGGKAVADYLCRENPGWTVLSPATLGLVQPLTELTEFQYARFCRQFERAATAAIQRHSPHDHIVLSNDISEGPDFAALAGQGYRLATIFHVDVVEYFTKFYLRDWVEPATAARWSRYRWLPDILKLVFHKQADAVRHSQWLIVPSAPMKQVLSECYPGCAAKVHVLPWGNIAAPVTAAPADAGNDFVIMTLSRLSPEKGIERLLEAVKLVPGNLRVWICGAPAYMQGRRYAEKLHRLADPRVEFLGHVAGHRKAALLARANLFVSPSLHESYGLTIAEAEAVGCPVISHAHHGARGQVVDCANPVTLANAICEAMAQDRTRLPATVTSSDASRRLSDLLQTGEAIVSGSDATT